MHYLQLPQLMQVEQQLFVLVEVSHFLHLVVYLINGLKVEIR
jgi:hypothetical protein